LSLRVGYIDYPAIHILNPQNENSVTSTLSMPSPLSVSNPGNSGSLLGSKTAEHNIRTLGDDQ